MMSDAEEVARLRDENAYLRSLLQDLVDSAGPLIPRLERLVPWVEKR